MMPAAVAMDEAVKKKVLRKLTYGLFVATSGENSGTVNWVSQVSFTPPCVLVAIKKGTGLWTAVTQSKRFALSILGKDQKSLAQEFFKGPSPAGGKLAGFPVIFKTTGCPILREALGAVECEVLHAPDVGGDHTPFIGKVVDAHLFKDEEPLGLFETGWFYGG